MAETITQKTKWKAKERPKDAQPASGCMNCHNKISGLKREARDT
jgi:hypothetical protein